MLWRVGPDGENVCPDRKKQLYLLSLVAVGLLGDVYTTKSALAHYGKIGLNANACTGSQRPDTELRKPRHAN